MIHLLKVCKIFLAERVVEITAPCKAAVESYFRFIIVRDGTRRIEKFIGEPSRVLSSADHHIIMFLNFFS